MDACMFSIQGPIVMANEPAPDNDTDEAVRKASWSFSVTDVDNEAADPLLGALVALTKHYGRPYSVNALRSGLPLENNRLTPGLFVRAAARARLSARVNKRKLKHIPDMVLPAVLLLKERDVCILLRRFEENGVAMAEVMFPQSGGGVDVAPMESIEQLYDGYAIFVKPDYGHKHRAEAVQTRSAGSWFWGTLLKFWPTYSQVLLAAVIINLFALASPLFVMNVYDRVVPNHAEETLWVLAIGVSIVILFDFILKTLRAYFVDNTGKRIDVLLSSRIFEQVLNIKLHARPESSGAFANRPREGKPLRWPTSSAGLLESLREFFSSAVLVAMVDFPFVILFLVIIYMIGGPVVLAPALAVPLVLAIGIFLQWPLRRAITKEIDQKSQKHGVILETIGSLETVKSLGAESRMQGDWERFGGRGQDQPGSSHDLRYRGALFPDRHADGNGRGDPARCLPDHAGRDDHRRSHRLHHHLRPGHGAAGAGGGAAESL